MPNKKSRKAKHQSNVRKDKKLILQAHQQVPLHIRPYNHTDYVSQDLVLHVNAILAQHEGKWNEMLQEIESAQSRQHWCQVEELATNLLESLVHIDLTQYMKDNVDAMDGVLLSYYCGESTLYRTRATARFQTGDARHAITDWTMSDITATSYNNYWNIDASQGKCRQTSMLQHRAMCFAALGDFERALVDIRASIALVRNCPGTLQAVATKSAIMALAKMKRDYPRPHYSGEERHLLEKELRVYAQQDSVCCEECGKNEGLLLCQGCHGEFYCSQRCQKKAWKNGHKLTCNKSTNPPEFMLDSTRALVDESYTEGVGVGTNTAGRELVLHRDSWSQRYFESLTDADVYFLPSEFYQVPEKYEELARAIMEEEMLRLPKEQKQESRWKTRDLYEMLVHALVQLLSSYFFCNYITLVLDEDQAQCVEVRSPNDYRVDCHYFW